MHTYITLHSIPNSFSDLYKALHIKCDKGKQARIRQDSPRHSDLTGNLRARYTQET